MDDYFNQFHDYALQRPSFGLKTEEEEYLEKKNFGFLSKNSILLSDLVQENRYQTEEEKEDIFINLWRNLRKQNNDFQALFDNFSVSEKIENGYENLTDKDKLEFMFIVHAYEDHRIRDLVNKYENLQIEHQHSQNTIKERETKISKMDIDCCRLKEDCNLLLERNESLIRENEKLKKEKENVDKYEKSQIDKLTEEKKAIINNLELELDRLLKSSQQKIDEIKTKYVQEIDLLKSNYKYSIEKLEKERDEIFKEKEDLEKENGLLKAELNSIKIKKLNTVTVRNENYNTTCPVAIKNKKLCSSLSIQEGKGEEYNTKVDSTNTLTNNNIKNNSKNNNGTNNNNFTKNNNLNRTNNFNNTVINSNSKNNKNTAINSIKNKGRLSNVSMSPINLNFFKKLKESDKRLSNSSKTDAKESKESKETKETSISPVKAPKKNSISFSAVGNPLNESLSFLEEKQNFYLNNNDEIPEDKHELENNLFNLDNYSNNGGNISLNDSLAEDEEQAEEAKSENAGVRLDTIFCWDEYDTAGEKRKSARMSKRISNAFDTNINIDNKINFNSSNNDNNFINFGNNTSNKNYFNISGISSHSNNLSQLMQQPQSNNASSILQKLDSKRKDKNSGNSRLSKSKIMDVGNLSAISANGFTGNNQLNAKPRGKLSILYNGHGVLSEKEKEKPKKESIMQQVAFNLKINIKQKKNNFNYNNFMKQIRKNDNKPEKVTEIVSKKYEMGKDLDSKKKQFIDTKTPTIEDAKNESSISLGELLDEDDSPSLNRRKSKAAGSIITASTSERRASLVFNGKESLKRSEVKSFQIEEKAKESSNEKAEENVIKVAANCKEILNDSKEEYRKKLEAELNSLAIAAEKETKEINSIFDKNINNKEQVINNPKDENKSNLMKKNETNNENYNSNLSLNSNNNNSIIEGYTPCCQSKEYSVDNSYCLQDENNPLDNSYIKDEGLFDFKIPDNLNTADEDYYVANNVIRFGDN